MSWRLVGNVSRKVYCEAETKGLCNAWKVNKMSGRKTNAGSTMWPDLLDEALEFQKVVEK